jgi:hypothetical protein
MYYTIYKITNMINDKIYIGMHKTNNLDDGYYGSGNLIKKAIKKYGIENFTKEYIAIVDSEAEMVKLEESIVNSEFVSSSDTYNLRTGGCGVAGTFSKVNSNSDSQRKKAYKSNEKQKELRLDEDWVSKKSEKITATMKRQYETGVRIAKTPDWTGKRHTDESKRKIGESNSKRQKGEGNSQYGTCWIHSLTLQENKRINKEDLNDWISEGWIKGRKMKF